MKTMSFTPFSVVCRGRLVEFDRPAVMGILNVTADSFYDGGRHLEPEAMLAHARSLLADGADIVDVGVSSSRPGAQLLDPDVEAQRLGAAIALLRSELPDVLISADTCFSLPARAAVEAGADIVNDIGGGDTDPLMFAAVAEMQVPYILMHGAAGHLGLDTDDGDGDGTSDLVDRLTHFFSRRLDTLYRLGVKDVWLDPGFGFGKGLAGDHELLRRLDELTSLFREPLLAALSRKSMVFRPLGITAADALEGTVALDALALDRGARLLRVHDPRPARQTIDLMFNDFHTAKPQQSK